MPQLACASRVLIKCQQNGTFAFSDPVDCSPLDTVGHSCARGTDNDVGFYECQYWPSLLAVRLTNPLSSIVLGVQLLCASFDGDYGRAYGRERYVHQSSVCTFQSVARLLSSYLYIRDHYFDKGYFLAGNEPSFAVPLAYHYAGRPDKSALRVREVVFENFNTGIGGVCHHLFASQQLRLT